MDLRVTNQTSISRMQGYMRQQTDRLAVTQQQAASGKRINNPSDDPLGAVKVLAASSQDNRLQSYLGNIRDARTTLQISNSATVEVHQLLTSARQAGLTGANSGNGPAELTALAEQVDSLLNRLVDVGNSQQDGRYLFAGTATDKQPFAISTGPGGDSVTYQGGADTGTVPISAQQHVDALYVGSTVFQQDAGGADVFKTVIGLRDALKNTANLDDGARVAAINQRLADLERADGGVLGVMGEQASNLQNLDSMESRTQSVQLETRVLRGNIESSDLTEVVVQLQSQQNLLQLTLATSAKMFDQSLLDFIQ